MAGVRREEFDHIGVITVDEQPGETWVEGVPVIDAPAFCGTGTRYLSPSGRAAIEALFARSFEASAAGA